MTFLGATMKYELMTLALGLSLSGVLYANQNIDLTNSETNKSILVGKTWICHMDDAHGKTPSYWTFHEAKGNKITGKLVIPQYKMCSSDKFKATLKENTLKYYAPANNKFCVAVNGVIRFSYDEDGTIVGDGHYTYGGLREVGEYKCELNTS